MAKEKVEYLTRSQEDTRMKRRKQNRFLNYLITLVTALIVIALFVIFTMQDDKEEVAEEEQAVETDSGTESQSTVGVDESEEETTEESSISNHDDNESSVEDGEVVENNQSSNIVNASENPVVDETWTSEAWQPYTTVQTGEHRSTFDPSHIDYQEKLGAIFSVLPIAESESIIWSVKNNGNAKSAIAVISSNDKVQKYRVAIEWVEQQGWKPIQVEVLNTLDGAY